MGSICGCTSDDTVDRLPELSPDMISAQYHDCREYSMLSMDSFQMIIDHWYRTVHTHEAVSVDTSPPVNTHRLPSELIELICDFGLYLIFYSTDGTRCVFDSIIAFHKHISINTRHFNILSSQIDRSQPNMTEKNQEIHVITNFVFNYGTISEIKNVKVGKLLGVFLGEGRNKSLDWNEDHLTMCRNLYFSFFDKIWIDATLSEALRSVRNVCGVGWPPESQQIDRVISALADRYTIVNKTILALNGSLTNNNVLVCFYAGLLLNTDFHNYRAIAANRGRKMSPADFQRLLDGNGPIPPELVEELYNSITKKPLEWPVE